MSSNSDLGEELKEIKGIRFTSRELEVLSCLSYGRSAKTIADLLNISPKTVENHTHNIMSKMGCNSREKVLDFIESSGKSQSLRYYYVTIKINRLFERYIQKLQIKEPLGSIKIKGVEKHLEKEILNHLKSVGISLKLQKKTQENKSILVLKGSGADSFGELDLSGETNSYIAIFRILVALIKNPHGEEIYREFKVAYEKIVGGQEEETHRVLMNQGVQLPKAKNLRFIASLFVLLLICGVSYYFVRHSQSHVIARSDLIIPTESALLMRTSLLSEMDIKLEGPSNINSIALIGVGGAGKTTLARQYAKTQSSPVVWEINAETHATLISSLERLAYALSNKDEDEKLLKGLQFIKTVKDKETTLLYFVREKLKDLPHWILIFDNVVDFADIQNFFPQDKEMWGKGKIIITTRNQHLSKNSHIKQVVVVNTLDEKEKIELFQKINNDPQNNSPHVSNLKDFLKEIPSYPLDVSISAYYIKATNSSYENYLNHLSRNDQSFETVQREVLKEEGTYENTRNQIVSLSLHTIMQMNKEFSKLLAIIGVLDSQHIPVDLLHKFSNVSTVENLIYQLKKYSLLDQHPYDMNSGNTTISFHADTHNAIRKLMGADHSNRLNQHVSIILEHLNGLCDSGVMNQVFHSLSHYEALRKYDEFLNDELKCALRIELGNVYLIQGKNYESKKILYDALNVCSNSTEQKLRVLKYLGSIERILGNYERANELFKEAQKLAQKESPKNYDQIAWILSHLGNTHWYIGNYIESKNDLERSYSLYKEQSPHNYDGIAWTLSRLGNTYRDLGEYNKAKKLLETSIDIYQTHLPKNDIRKAQALVFLGIIERKLRHYSQAKSHLESALKIYRRHFLDSHPDVAWILVHLGHVENYLGNYEHAKQLTLMGLKTYNENFPQDHIRIARAYVHLGCAEQGMGNYKQAHDFILKGLKIVEENYPHSIEYPRFLTHAAGSESSLGNHEQALNYIKKAVEIFSDSYGKDHIEVGWALSVLGNIENRYEQNQNAKSSLEIALNNYSTNLTVDNVEIGKIYKVLGDVHIALGDMGKAKTYLLNAQKIYSQEKHPNLYMIYESLADLDVKMKDVSAESSEHKNKAKINYTKALSLLKKHFPANCPHVERIQNKLNDLQKI